MGALRRPMYFICILIFFFFFDIIITDWTFAVRDVRLCVYVFFAPFRKWGVEFRFGNDLSKEYNV